MFKIKYLVTLCLSLFLPLTVLALDTECIDLFKSKKIIPGNSSCLTSCLTVKVDMATFICHDQCDQYCTDNCKSILANLEKKLKKDSPSQWPLAEKKSEWKPSEKELVAEALSQEPDQLIGTVSWQIYRMQKSVHFPNPASNADTYPRSIALYDTAFYGKFNLSRVIAHELAHIYYQNMLSDDSKNYRMMMNWFAVDSTGKKWVSRKDGFVKEDGRNSPEEDFANNVEYFLFDRQILKKTTPHAFEWIESNIKDLKVKKGCRYGK